ncbi:MAG: UDP-2-acetamido-2-deoxy-3-oxo-D-glucuronate aminotransferase [Gammaproteobacteria bacterium]|nr:UDP-2-acetamido-2-deoxy-3-oxo-D-glucuronate aminotransferase [Gammaproteobacteria bacterium]
MRYLLDDNMVIDWLSDRKLSAECQQKLEQLLSKGKLNIAASSLPKLEAHFKASSAHQQWRQLLSQIKIAKTPSYLDPQTLSQSDSIDSYLLEQSAKAIDAKVVRSENDLPQSDTVLPINFIDLKEQYHQMQSEMEQAMDEVLNNSQFIMGPAITKLEQTLSQYTGSTHALTCGNGTDALMLALMAIDIQPGDEVITTVYSFFATAEVIALFKAVPVFVDIEQDTYNIDVSKIAARISHKTKAIIPVGLYGQVADMQEINQIAKQHSNKLGHKIYVIEDACQSFGAEYRQQKSCHLSDIACTSFFPAKPLGCYGDGGAIFTDDAALAKKIDSLRLHGQSTRYYHKYIGMNARFDNLQAAILNVKMQTFADEVRARLKLGHRYNELLKGSDIVIPMIKSDRVSVYAQYSIRVKNRDAVVKYLNEHKVPTAIHYPMPLHLQECFKEMGFKAGDYPVAEQVANEILSLPMSPFLTEAQQDYIVKHLLNAVK